MHQSLNIRLTKNEHRAIDRLKLIYNCETDTEAMHSLLQLIDSIPDTVMQSLQTLASQELCSFNHQVVVLLREAVQQKESHQSWLSYTEPVE